MRVIALIDDAAVIRKILSHLSLYPPVPSTPVLTYHPVPDIA